VQLQLDEVASIGCAGQLRGCAREEDGRGGEGGGGGEGEGGDGDDGGGEGTAQHARTRRGKLQYPDPVVAAGRGGGGMQLNPSRTRDLQRFLA